MHNGLISQVLLSVLCCSSSLLRESKKKNINKPISPHLFELEVHASLRHQVQHLSIHFSFVLREKLPANTLLVTPSRWESPKVCQPPLCVFFFFFTKRYLRIGGRLFAVMAWKLPSMPFNLSFFTLSAAGCQEEMLY